MLSLVTAAVLLAVTVLGTTSCNRTIGEKATATTKQAELAKPIEIGEGANSFAFSIHSSITGFRDCLLLMASMILSVFIRGLAYLGDASGS